MTFWLRIFLGLTLVSLSLANAQGKTDFSGTWILDKSESDVSHLMSVGETQERLRDASMTMVVDQQGSNLRVTRMVKTTGEERKEIHTYKTDGGETTNTGFQGETVVARGFWEGEKLVIVSTRRMKVFLKDITVESRGVWSLSPDGKTLRISTQIYGPREQRVKAIFGKQ